MLYKNLFIFLFLLFGTNLVMAEELRHHQRVDGMNIYLDVFPLPLAQKDENMHGGVTDEKDNYHIVVTLFDIKTGKRITNASVQASVEPLGIKYQTKDLEPMYGELNYGNYFTMYKAIHYNVKVEIRRANSELKSVAMFIFKRPQDK